MKKIILILSILTQIIYSQTYLIEKKVGNITIYEQAQQETNTIIIQENEHNELILKEHYTTITSEQIERQGLNNLQEILSKQPLFINTGSYMGNEVVTPIGGNPDQVKIYLNDVLLNVAKGNASAGVDLRRIPSTIIDKVIIKGLSIYIYTKQLTDTTYFEIGYGSYNTIPAKALISRSYSNRLNFTFTADSYYTDGNYNFNITNNNQHLVGNFTNNRQYRFNTSFNLTKQFRDKDELQLYHNSSFTHSASYYNIPPLPNLDSWFNFTTSLTSLSYKYHNPILNTKITTSYVFDSFVDRPFYDGLYVSDYKSHKINTSLNFDRVDEINDNLAIFSQFDLQYTYETLIESHPSLMTNFNSSPQRHSFQLNIRPTLYVGYYNDTPILELTPNLRYEQNTNPYFAYGINSRINIFNYIFLTYEFNSDYTIPNFNDLYYNNFSNPNLKPEYYYSHTSGFELIPIDDLTIKTTYQYYEYKDKIIWTKQYPTNYGNATAYAINPSITYNPTFDIHGLNASLSYIYQSSVLKELGTQRIGIPLHQINTLLGYDLFLNSKSLTSLSINITYTYASQRPITDIYPVYYSIPQHDLGINIYSVWIENLVISTHFNNILNSQPILSQYSIQRPFEWNIKIGYNFR